MVPLRSLKHAFLAGAVYAALCGLAPALSAAPPSYTYDMTPYETMAKESLKLVAAGDMKGALNKALELEGRWDDSTGDLKAADPDLWDLIDQQMDNVVGALGGKDTKKATKELNSYLELVARVPKPVKK